MKLESNAPIASEDVTFVTPDKRSIPGTLVRPTSAGKHRAVVLMAGSGPTDRNWNSPLLQGDNGSAKLLAEALGHRGFAVLRFDKALTGDNKIDMTKVSFETYVDEGRAAIGYMRQRSDVDATQLYIAGHSEGGIHATRVALAEGKAIAGLITLAGPGRAMVDVLIGQVAENWHQALLAKAPSVDQAMADREMTALRTALSDFLAGKDVDPLKVTAIPRIQGLLAAIVNPATAAMARPLFGFDPANAIAKVQSRVMIYNGAHDVQVDHEIDAQALAKARPDATLFIAPNANHVMKHEERGKPELLADLVGVQRDYNAPEAVIDAASVEAIAAWLAK